MNDLLAIRFMRANQWLDSAAIVWGAGRVANRGDIRGASPVGEIGKNRLERWIAFVGRTQFGYNPHDFVSTRNMKLRIALFVPTFSLIATVFAGEHGQEAVAVADLNFKRKS